MADRLVLQLHEPVQARQAFAAAWEKAKALTMAGNACGNVGMEASE